MLPPRGYVFIGLNGIRALSIVGLLLVFCSNVVTLAHDIEAVNRFHGSSNSATGNTTTVDTNSDYIAGSTVPNEPFGVFWAVLNRLLIIGQVLILILSEIGWPSAFFNRFFPVLGDDFGLGALGIIECLIGAAVLSHHVDTFTLVAAFFLFSIGCLNMLVGLIFRQSAKTKRSFTAWRDHAKSALPTHVAGVDVRSVASNAPSFVSGMFPGKEEPNEQPPMAGPSSGGSGFGLKGEKAAGLKGFFISKPLESLPRYASKPTAA